ncbi:MAG: hypothetical protein ACXIUZ_04635 [Lysobacteraceae bacterium]
MPDFLIRDIDGDVAERIKEMARERGWPLNDTIIHLIKQALGLVAPDAPVDPRDISRLGGQWEDTESKALQEAMAAFKDLPDDNPY